MEHPNIKASVIADTNNYKYLVVGIEWGMKEIICEVPYEVIFWSEEAALNSEYLSASKQMNDKNRNEALEHAKFISYCFNNPKNIIGFEDIKL